MLQRAQIMATAWLALALASPATMAEEGGQSEEMSRALAAGYKAAFTCSATYNAGQTVAEIEANELSGIYPDYRAALAALPPAEFDDSAFAVSVDYGDDMPARIAVWRPGFGCTQLPIGAGPEAADWINRFGSWPPPGRLDRASAIGADVALSLPVGLQNRLEAPTSFAFDGATYGAGTRTSAVLIARGGEIVAERYARGINQETPQRTWSVAKSITATILGAAIENGLIGLDSTALLANWNNGGDPRREITLENLLHMASGLDSGESGARTDRVYFGGARVVDQAITAPLEAPPGTRFKYANNDTLAAIRALREAMNDDAAFHNYAYRELLWKIGARRTTLEVDWNGDVISSSQVWTTARDLARIGELYLNDGIWAGERILPEGWAAYVATPAPAQPPETVGVGYGAQFWLLNDSPGVPADTFAAMGHRGQYLVIIPSRDLVIVRRGYDESGGTRFEVAAFTRDVVSAVDAADAAERAEQEIASAIENGLARRLEDGTVVWLDERGRPILDEEGRPIPATPFERP